jgi:hypothetical protein
MAYQRYQVARYYGKEGVFTLKKIEGGYYLYLRTSQDWDDVPWAEEATTEIVRGSLQTLGRRRGNVVFRALMKKLNP